MAVPEKVLNIIAGKSSLLMNITTSVDSSDKLNYFQAVVDESISAKRYISQTQSI
ncbi:MAG: hypothetical protein IPI97_05655 [Nitrosomonas sp.]|nr:hypothetical protein [Nitrosomonas sp.]MBK7364493.1 hypothetical protein [Nitrosomonas sp.]